MKKNVQKLFDELFVNYPVLEPCRNEIASAFSLMVTCYENKGKMLVCGNGGSAADSEHIVGELMKSFRIKREVPQSDIQKFTGVDPEMGQHLSDSLQPALPAISLVSQTSLFSAFANDVNSDMVFAQQVYGYGEKNDMLLAISTSGNSTNVCNAARVGKAIGLSVVGLIGKTGGILAQFCNVAICVPSEATYRIQEYHQPIYHALCAMLEEEFFGE